jgi:hypothetical protein
VRNKNSITKRVPFVLFLLALAITTIRALKHADAQYSGLGAAVSADVAATARTFATEGIWKLRGVPVNNNPPIGPNDQYTHWPPLLPILLSGCFHLFGTTERTAHIFMLCVLLATALLVLRLGCLWLGPIGGALAGYFWLTLPVVNQFGDLVAQQSLAMLFLLAALLAFYSARETLGAILLFLAVLSSWESALVIPGIWLAARQLPKLRSTAFAATLGAGTALACVMTLFILGSPQLIMDTLQTIKFYMGLSPVYSHISHNAFGVITSSQQLRFLVGNHLFMLGPLGLIAVIVLLVRRPDNSLLLISFLATPWIIWTIVMRTHTALHNFELLIAAPLAALALAWLATADLRIGWSKHAALRAAAFVAVAALTLFLPRPTTGGDPNPDSQIRYAHDIRSSTPAGSVIAAPTFSAVPLYYSERNIIRGIANDDVLSGQLPDIQKQFPASPLYLAIPPSLATSFGRTLSHATIVSSTPDAIIAKL